MKKNFTEMVFILDRSGSMQGLEKDTIGGFNSLTQKQKGVSGSARITTVLFDDRFEILHDGEALTAVKPMTQDDYFVRGSTALLDAIGKTVTKIGHKLAIESEAQRPDKVMVVIITDGMENASREYDAEKVKQMIEHQKSKYNWEFLFLGANIDAVGVAKSVGIEEDRAVEYLCDSQGTALNFESVNCVIKKARCGQKIDASWKEEIMMDMMMRSDKE